MAEDHPAFEPDTKDWTWVLVRRCSECDFDARDVDCATIGGLIRAVAAEWTVVLARPVVAVRPPTGEVDAEPQRSVEASLLGWDQRGDRQGRCGRQGVHLHRSGHQLDRGRQRRHHQLTSTLGAAGRRVAGSAGG
jgi:hypothetical protein